MTKVLARPFQFIFDKIVDFLFGWIEPTIISVVNDKDNAKRPEPFMADEPVPLWDRASLRIAELETETAAMLGVIVAQERMVQRLSNELHAVTAQVVTLQAKVDAWEADD